MHAYLSVKGRRMMRIGNVVLAGILAAAIAFPALAHEGHREDMSDEEMAMESSPAANEEAATEHGHDTALATPVAKATRLGADPGTASKQDDVAEAEEAAAPPSPGVSDAVSGPSAGSSDPQALQSASERNRAESPGDFLGRLHPVATHFPVALLLIAALAELLLVLRPALGLQPTIRFLVIAGGIGSLIAAPLGWFAAGWRLTDRSETLYLHRWLGTGIAVASLAALWLVTRKGENRTSLRTLLIVLAVALMVQGYLGGEMVFGPNHLGIR